MCYLTVKKTIRRIYFESGSVRGLKIRHAFEGQFVVEELPQDDCETVCVDFMVVMLFLTLS